MSVIFWASCEDSRSRREGGYLSRGGEENKKTVTVVNVVVRRPGKPTEPPERPCAASQPQQHGHLIRRGRPSHALRGRALDRLRSESQSRQQRLQFPKESHKVHITQYTVTVNPAAYTEDEVSKKGST